MNRAPNETVISNSDLRGVGTSTQGNMSHNSRHAFKSGQAPTTLWKRLLLMLQLGDLLEVGKEYEAMLNDSAFFEAIPS